MRLRFKDGAVGAQSLTQLTNDVSLSLMTALLGDERFQQIVEFRPRSVGDVQSDAAPAAADGAATAALRAAAARKRTADLTKTIRTHRKRGGGAGGGG